MSLTPATSLAGEWADSAAFARCRLVELELPAGLLPGPAFAAPDEVLVSGTVHDLVAGSGIEFQEQGIHELKGVPDRWRLYRVAEA